MTNAGNSPRAIALALCDGLLEDLRRAKSSAQLNRGVESVGNVIKSFRLIGGALVLGLVALVFLNAYVPFWLAATLVVAGEGGLVALWIVSRRGRRRPPGPNFADAADDDRSALDASVSQLNTIVSDMQAEGVKVPNIDFLSGSLARLERDVRALRATLQQLG